MSRLRRRSISVSILIDARPPVVWDAVADISTHVEWMADARAIRFTGPSRSGPGTTFECDTKIGPFRVTDEMRITSWRPPEEMGVAHEGVVSGTGTFALEPVAGERTRFAWTEQLELPWWLGGSLGGLVASPIMGWIWRRNLSRLKALVEDGAP